jgi:hypothetical protein
MGHRISGITDENFLKHLGQQLIKHLLENKTVIYYVKYVDEILSYKVKYMRYSKKKKKLRGFNPQANYTD